MRKIIVSINTTPDGFCDHRFGIVDDALMNYYVNEFKKVDTVLFGRVTYQLMESAWPEIAKNKTGTKSEIEFAELIDSIDKIVFSKTLTSVEWKKTTLLHELNRETILELKQKPGKDILAGGPGFISELTRLGLIDEYRFLVHPLIPGKGKRFFETTSLDETLGLKLIDTKTFDSGVIMLRYNKK